MYRCKDSNNASFILLNESSHFSQLITDLVYIYKHLLVSGYPQEFYYGQE